MKRIIAAILVLGIAAGIGLNIGPSAADCQRIMQTPEFQQEFARRVAL